MSIRQFHQALTTSNDTTIAALRRLREQEHHDVESLAFWFFWL